jgi:hypothetical protein
MTASADWGARAAAPSGKAGTGAAPAEEKKAKPITKAMAQAAAKILTADDLVASVPVAKKAASAPAPRALAAQPPRATRPAPPAKAASTHPFDDRL